MEIRVLARVHHLVHALGDDVADGHLPRGKLGDDFFFRFLGGALCFLAGRIGVRAHFVGGLFAGLSDLCPASAASFSTFPAALLDGQRAAFWAASSVSDTTLSAALAAAGGGFLGRLFRCLFYLVKALLGPAGIGHDAENDLAVMFACDGASPPGMLFLVFGLPGKNGRLAVCHGHIAPAVPPASAGRAYTRRSFSYCSRIPLGMSVRSSVR